MSGAVKKPEFNRAFCKNRMKVKTVVYAWIVMRGSRTVEAVIQMSAIPSLDFICLYTVDPPGSIRTTPSSPADLPGVIDI